LNIEDVDRIKRWTCLNRKKVDYALSLKGTLSCFLQNVFMPFHAAEHRGKERISDSAERSDFPMSPVLGKERRMSIVGSSKFADNPAMRDQVIGCTFFWFVSLGKLPIVVTSRMTTTK